jgi:hypothetical protein
MEDIQVVAVDMERFDPREKDIDAWNRAWASWSVNTSGKAGAQITHIPLGDDSSPSGDNAVGR